MSSKSSLIQGNIEPATFTPLVSLVKNYKIGALLAICIIAVGVPIVISKGKSTYTTTAVVYVGPQFVNILQDRRELSIDSYQQFRQFVDQQSRTISRYDIIMRALDNLGEERSIWQKEGESARRAAERLQAALTITAVKNTYLITVSMESAEPQGLEKLVNSVVDTYVSTVKSENFLYASDTRLVRLEKRREDIKKVIEEGRKKRTMLAQLLGVTTFIEVALNPYDQLLLESKMALAKAKREYAKAEAQLNIIDPERGEKSKIALETIAGAMVGKDSGLNSLKESLFQRRSDLVRQFSGLDSTHPLYGILKQEMNDIDNNVADATQKLSASIQNTLLEERKAELRLATQLVTKLNERIDEQSKNAAWFASNYNEALLVNEEKLRLQDRLQKIEQRIDFLRLESQAPGFIRIESYARAPEIPTGGGKKKLAIIFVALSGMLGIGVPIGIDLLDRSIKNGSQIEKLIGHKPLAVILEYSEEMCVRHVINDQMKRLLLALERERQQNNNLSSLLLTSVKPGAGVTSLAFELGLHFGEMGVSTIVVEANSLKPDYRYLAVESSLGLLDVIIDDSFLDQAIVPAEGILPDRLPIGLAIDRHLHAYHRIGEIVDNLKERYDVVLVDAPPLLLSADVEYLSAMADATLLLIGASQIQPGELKRAAQILERVNPPLISFLLTRLKVFKGGGYYAEMFEYAVAEKAVSHEIFSAPETVEEEREKDLSSVPDYPDAVEKV